MSLDGDLDAADQGRLILSNEADLQRVDALRAACDAILVGAATVRNDNPPLPSAARPCASRRERGWAETPMKVTITRRADLDPCNSFFSTGDSEKLVYCASPAVLRCPPTPRHRGDRGRRRRQRASPGGWARDCSTAASAG